MDVEAVALQKLTREECLEELQAEPSRHILLTLVKARRDLLRMRGRRNSGEVSIFVRNGKIETVQAPDSFRVPED